MKEAEILCEGEGIELKTSGFQFGSRIPEKAFPSIHRMEGNPLSGCRNRAKILKNSAPFLHPLKDFPSGHGKEAEILWQAVEMFESERASAGRDSVS